MNGRRPGGAVSIVLLATALAAAAVTAATLDPADPPWKWLVVPTAAAAAVLWLGIGLVVVLGGASLFGERRAPPAIAILAGGLARAFGWTAEALRQLHAARELDALDRALRALETRILALRDIDTHHVEWQELAGRWIRLASAQSEPVRRLGGLPEAPDLALGRSRLPPHVNLSSRDLRSISAFLAEKQHLDDLRAAHREWMETIIARIAGGSGRPAERG